MAIKPILFNTEMVRAILDGRKSCTRRLVKTRRKDACGFYVTKKADGTFSGIYEYDENESMFDNPLMPPYQPWDILYVRETWKKAPNGYYYYEDWQRNDIADVTRWHPSIHMPKEDARIWLKVKDVRVERLKEITEEQALSEGVPDDSDYPISKVYCPRCHGEGLIGAVGASLGYMEIDCPNCDTAIKRFKNLWTSTIKKSDLDRYGWDASPLVWVIEFERCEKPEGV